MSIIAAYCVPHPPLIIPEIGKGEEKQIQATVNAFTRVAREIADLKPDTIIITSPHVTMYREYFNISSGKSGHGDFKRFGYKNIYYDVTYDEELISRISNRLKIEDFPGGTEGVKNEPLDHGTMIPLHFIQKELKNLKVVRVGLSGLPLQEHYELGVLIKEEIENLNRRAVFIASGDLSHMLKADGPYGFNENGPVYDRRIMEILSSGNFGELLAFNQSFLEEAGECGHRSFTIMAGALDKTAVEAEQYSYEGPFGVGYGIVGFKPKDQDPKRAFLDIEVDVENTEAPIYVHPLVKLALCTIKTKLEGKELNLSDYLKTAYMPKEFLSNKAGVFVSLKKYGELRGCIGTISPTTESVCLEVIQNAIDAAFGDPRFYGLRKNEFKDIKCSVDVLSPAEPISYLSELDVKHYGVIVTQGRKRGLLLPDLDGVDTVEEQLSIAKQKAGIKDNNYSIERFKVVRYS